MYLLTNFRGDHFIKKNVCDTNGTLEAYKNQPLLKTIVKKLSDHLFVKRGNPLKTYLLESVKI